MYSEEWQLEDNENYEIVRANGGFLGIIVKSNISDVNIKISFNPSGVEIGFIGTLIGFGVYGGYCLWIYLRKKKLNEKEEIVNE